MWGPKLPRTNSEGGTSRTFSVDARRTPHCSALIPPPFRSFHHLPDSPCPATYINSLLLLAIASPSKHSIKFNKLSNASPTRGDLWSSRSASENGENGVWLGEPDDDGAAAPTGHRRRRGWWSRCSRQQEAGPDARAMAATPTDVKELSGAYVFLVGMLGLGSGDIKVQVEDERVLVINGERRREEKEDAKCMRVERCMGKMMRKFVLPENTDMEKISVTCRGGMLTMTVEKLPPSGPKKPKTIQVQVA
ncbi:unnamed protein product [Triticum turgidum subsp. durum]|uniref:SHSP domain-containing protein n=2 Tax=Triticum TaxID=4564 RepID=A0A9R1QA15_TRITD|nr:unnamed protein product [Triticum aestivum]VAH73570.1 unnamed protein product [Triticum turgidum subsp. durum]